MKCFENNTTLKFESSFLPSFLGSADGDVSDMKENIIPGKEEYLVLSGEQAVRTSVDDYVLEAGDKMIVTYDPDADENDCGCDIEIHTAEERIFSFKPTQSVDAPNVKYAGWFSCGSHCACNDCSGCVITATQKEADENPGCHFYE